MKYDSNNHVGPPGGIVGPLPGESASAASTKMSASRAEDRRLLGLIEQPMGIDATFDDGGAKHPFMACIVGDSVCMAYCSKNKRELTGLLKHPGDVVKYKWEHAMIANGSGWTALQLIGP
eukprot:14173179-Heterocapsa_arctica.AAC.1